MAAPISNPVSPDPNPPTPSTWDPLAPSPSVDDIARQFLVPDPQHPPTAEPGQDPTVADPAVPSPPAADPTEGGEADPALETLPEGEVAPEVVVPEDGAIHTVAQLAEVMGVEQDGLLAGITIDDAEGNAVALSDVVGAWRATPDAEALAEERVGLEAQYGQRHTELQAQHDEVMTQASSLVQMLHSEIMSGPDDAAIQLMEVDDPQGAREARLLRMERTQMIERTLGQLQTESQRRAEGRQQAESTRLQGEMRRVGRFWPEIINPATRTEVHQTIRSYLGGVGATKEQIDSNLNNAVMFRVLKDALHGAAVRKASKGGIEKLKERGLAAPRPAPQARQEAPGPEALDAKERSRRFGKLEQSHSIDDAAAVFEGML